MATSYIVMKSYTAEVDVPGKDRRRNEPRFIRDTEADALALSKRLNRANVIWRALVNLTPELQGDDHAAQLSNAEAVCKAIDGQMTADSRYTVEPVVPYDGPADDVTAVFQALMTAFAALPDPPDNPFEALYRLIRDAGG
jgi:hypothetical protein